MAARNTKTPDWLSNIKKNYSKAKPAIKFMYWWFPFIAVSVIVGTVIASIIWSYWIGIIVGGILALGITIACFIYLEDGGYI